MPSELTPFTRFFESYRAMRCLLLATYSPLGILLLLGFVIAPFNNRPEVGDPGPANDRYTSNRGLADLVQNSISPLCDQLAAKGDSWLVSWNPHIECGTPQQTMGGMSKAYLPTHVLFFLFHEPFTLYAWLTLFTLVLMGLFAFGLCEEMLLHPAACYVAAVTFSLGPFSLYWLTHLMHLNSLCWTMGLLWLVTAYARRGGTWRLGAVAFCVNSLLLTGYPVLIVLLGYILVPFTLATLIVSGRRPRTILALTAGLLAAALLGITATLPVLIDLFHKAHASSRLTGVQDAFYLEVLPRFADCRDIFTFLATSFDPFALGGPAAIEQPACAAGVLLTPLTTLLLGMAVVLAIASNGRHSIRENSDAFTERRAIPGFSGALSMRIWLLAMVAFFLFNTSSGAHLFAVYHLGLGSSRCRTCWAALIPACILVGMVVDHVLRNRNQRPSWLGFFVAAAAVCLLYAGLLASGVKASPCAMIAAATVALALALFLRTRSAAVIVSLAAAVAIGYGSYTVMLRPISSICLRSSLTDALKETSDGSCRYARVAPMTTALRPNEECLLGLYSVHSYDSLSSRRYQNVVKTWSNAEPLVYGRFFAELDRNSMGGSAEALSLAGDKYLVSEAPLELAWLEPAKKVDKFFVHTSRLPPRTMFQTSAFKLDEPRNASLAADSRAHDESVRCLTRENDHLHFATAAVPEESLLFLSQQYHDDWQVAGTSGPLKSVVVNGFYQGVILPPGTAEVDLRFKPWARWSWIPQAGFVALAVAFLIQWCLVKMKGSLWTKGWSKSSSLPR